MPDLRRCERIRWVRWVIENGVEHPSIDVWSQQRGARSSVLLWYDEQYLVVLAKRNEYWLLTTAYCTDRKHTVEKLKRERDAFFADATKS